VAVVQKVVHLGLVEVARGTERRTTDGASSRLGKTTTVKTQGVHVILLALLGKFSHALRGVALARGGRLGGVASGVAEVGTVVLVEVLLALRNEVLGLLPLEEVVVDFRFAHGKHRESLHHVSEFFSVGLAARGGVGMVLLDEGAVGVLDLLGGALLGYAENSVVVLLLGDFAVLGHCAEAADAGHLLAVE
jgi:hypothetical protein